MATTRKAKSPWRLLKDEKPAEREHVLVLLHDSDAVFTAYRKDAKTEYDERIKTIEDGWYVQRGLGVYQAIPKGRVRAWMPMPELPEVENDG